MLSKDKLESHERLDRIGLKVLRSLKVSEDEIEAVAGAPDLYDRVRSRIAAGPRQQRGVVRRGPRFIPIQRKMQPSVLWTLAAVALLLAVTLVLWRPGPSAEPGQLGQSPSPQAPSAPEQEFERSLPPGRSESEVGRASRLGTSRNHPPATSRRRNVRSRTTEVATEFFPLTFIADSSPLEAGHVVRVRIARSALVSFGVPMNVERADELVKADVVIGDDGLARAIRFIQ